MPLPKTLPRNLQFRLAALLLTLFGFGGQAAHAAPYVAKGRTYFLEILTEQQDIIWGFDFLPEGRIVFTERRGQLKLLNLKDKSVQRVSGLPPLVSRSENGVLDVRVHPRFIHNGWIYITYSKAVDGKTTVTLGRGRLVGTELQDVQILFSAFEPSSINMHTGSRIEFDGAGNLFLSLGDRNERDKAQELRYHTGKILRLNEDGTAPLDNPFAKMSGALAEIWSYGHRNPQGLTLHPLTGDLWSSEFGPQGGDELNVIRAGANYGWPVITYGRESSGAPIGEGTEKAGMEQPVVYWTPVISPSGIGFYMGNAFPEWKGNLFVAALSGQHLRRLAIENGKVVNQEAMLGDLGWRFRQVRQGPDDFLYFSTDNGQLGRLVPAP